MTILAIITDQGTACADGLCARCHEDPIARLQVEPFAAQEPDLTKVRWQEVSGNPEVSCVICGAEVMTTAVAECPFCGK